MQAVQEFLQRAKQESEEASLLQRVHHILMRNYGWIPLEEFKKLPLPFVWSLVEMINKEQEETAKAMEKKR